MTDTQGVSIKGAVLGEFERTALVKLERGLSSLIIVVEPNGAQTVDALSICRDKPGVIG